MVCYKVKQNEKRRNKPLPMEQKDAFVFPYTLLRNLRPERDCSRPRTR
jgi:hypothetical protein